MRSLKPRQRLPCRTGGSARSRGTRGVYVVMDLRPGHYDVTAHAPGFAPGTVTGVSLTPWQVQQMDLTLGDLPPSA